MGREKISNMIGNLREIKKKIKIATDSYEEILNAKKEELRVKCEVSEIEKKCKNIQYEIKDHDKIMNEQIDILKLVAEISKKSLFETEKAIAQNEFRLETTRAKIQQENSENFSEKSKIEQGLVSSKIALEELKADCQTCLEEYAKTIAYLEQQKFMLDQEYEELQNEAKLHNVEIPELLELIESKKDSIIALEDLLLETSQKNAENKQKQLDLHEQLQQETLNLISEEKSMEIDHAKQMDEWTQKNKELLNKIEEKKLLIIQKKSQNKTPVQFKGVHSHSVSSGVKKKNKKGYSSLVKAFKKQESKNLDKKLSSTSLSKLSQMTVNDLMSSMFEKQEQIKEASYRTESTDHSSPEETPKKPNQLTAN